MSSSSSALLGDVSLPVQKFARLKEILTALQTPAFLSLNAWEKEQRVSASLCALIQEEKAPCFALPAVVDYVAAILKAGLLESYTFSHFELWLNQFSSLSADENAQVRSKIVGKGIPRSAYQHLFPIGMDKVYPGSHFVTAHGSPDVDTTIASFWGWVDAFGARVAEGLHLWNVPGGAPVSQVEIGLLFEGVFGERVFEVLSKTRTTLGLSAVDLMTQKGLVRESAATPTVAIDHERMHNAVVLIDERGYYVGDWRSVDVEGVRQVVVLFNHMLRWFFNRIQTRLIALFAREAFSREDVPVLLKELFSAQFGAAAPVQELTQKQRQLIENYLLRVLQVEKGLNCSFEDFALAMQRKALPEFGVIVEALQSLKSSALFDASGKLTGTRMELFHYLEGVIQKLERALEQMNAFVDRLDVALQIKSEVFGHQPHSVASRADVDEIRAKMGQYPYLSVTFADSRGNHLALGVIHARELQKPVLGTVTLRDFCNRDETKIPSYFEVISVIDHHKSHLSTAAVPMALIADAQSSNVLCAEMAFEINDRFGSRGMTSRDIESQIAELSKDLSSAKNKRMLSNLLRRQCVIQEKPSHFIHPTRETLEYLHFLYGIFDDTDLLAKVSVRDLTCIVELVNRLKSLAVKREEEVLTLSDLPLDALFIRKAAQRILQHPDVYSLYQKIYAAKEVAVDASMRACLQGDDRIFFSDTKEQNSCARVGQTKLFPSNYALFSKEAAALRRHFQTRARSFFEDHEEVDLHVHMVSTIAGASEVFSGAEPAYKHQDELWLWIPFNESSVQHLKEFLHAFSSSSALHKQVFTAECVGKEGRAYADLLKESFVSMGQVTVVGTDAVSLVVLKFKPGLINSRKALITPFLPKPIK
jgi:hypothetical protein